MTTLTLHLPDAMEERLQMLAEAEGKDINNYATAQITDFLDADEAEAVASIRQGLDELDAGEGQLLEDFHTEMMRQRFR